MELSALVIVHEVHEVVEVILVGEWEELKEGREKEEDVIWERK